VEDIKSYIESGILELYVFGDLTPEEMLQVREMAAKYPEVKTELDEIERSLEKYAQENAIAPSDNQREKVLNSLLTNFADDATFANDDRVKIMPVHDEDDDNVIALPRANNFYKYAFAACLALLLISLVSLYSVYSKLQQSNEQIAVLTTQKQEFSKTVNFVQGELNVLTDTSFKFRKLQGTKVSPASKMAVAWSAKRREVWIDMKHTDLPANDKEHQYQLWALVKGKPVDLGVFDTGKDTTTDMIKMKPTVFADAFAVTLEPRGGSVNPTLSEMMVMGK